MKNRNKLLAILALSASFMLASCDKIYARPSKTVAEQTLINNSNVSHNEVAWLYDTLHDKETTPEEVRNAVLKILEEGLFGEFKINDNAEIKITGYDDASDSGKLDFIKTHKAYWDQETSKGSKKFEYVEPKSLTDTIKARVELFKQIVKREIIVSLYLKCNVEEFKHRGYFYEVKFARSLAKQFYEIGDVKNIFDLSHDNESSTIFSNKVLLDNSFSTEDVSTIVTKNNNAGKPALHVGLYDDYINKEIMPSVMETLLIEQYVYDEQYTAISRSQSRQVKYIGITADTSNVSDAHRLVNAFVNDVIKGAKKGEEIDYDLLADAWKGVYDDLFVNGKPNTAGQLLLDAGFELGTPMKDGTEIVRFADGKLASEHPYFKKTKYGNLIEDYAKITLNPKTTDEATENVFTSNGYYTIDIGLGIMTNDIRVEDYTVSDWGTKTNGFSDLPSALKDRLFDYTVMSDFNSASHIDNNSYIVEHNGHYFVKAEVAQEDTLEKTIVNKDQNSFYIVEILEAPSQAKLTIGGENAYENTASSGLKQETIARKIGYTIAAGSTYKTSAFQHYLEKCEILFNDQSIYDYFLKTYPDLFE